MAMMTLEPTRMPITLEGKKLLEAELNRLKTTERGRIIRAIEEAREHGDLSENAEYHAAKEEQGRLDARIRDLEDKLSRAEVIAPHASPPNRVVFGVAVTVADMNSEKELTYRLVGEAEAEPSENRISVNSPLGRALIGKEVGDEVIVRTPGGMRSYEVTDIDI